MPNSKPNRRAILGSLAGGAALPVLPTTGMGSSVVQNDDLGIRLGIITDPQYADKPTSGSRRYREAAGKLETAVAGINDAGVDLIVHLGDAIDGKENAETHLKRVFDIFATSETPVVHLVGNHCLDGGKALFDRASGMVAYYGAMRFNGWRFLLLDGNAISIRGHEPQSPAHVEAAAIIKAGRVSWGGGLGKHQRSWLDDQLKDAQGANERVLVLCHYPVDQSSNSENHLLWDYAEVSEILEKFDCVKAWFCGHNHRGGYGCVNGIHHVTFQAICDAPQQSNAWAIAECLANKIKIDGHGTVPSRDLDF